MRIAVASSGLGHVARGIETWAQDTASALASRITLRYLFLMRRLDGQGAGTGTAGAVCRHGVAIVQHGADGKGRNFLEGLGLVRETTKQRKT